MAPGIGPRPPRESRIRNHLARPPVSKRNNLERRNPEPFPTASRLASPPGVHNEFLYDVSKNEDWELHTTLESDLKETPGNGGVPLINAATIYFPDSEVSELAVAIKPIIETSTKPPVRPTINITTIVTPPLPVTITAPPSIFTHTAIATSTVSSILTMVEVVEPIPRLEIIEKIEYISPAQQQRLKQLADQVVHTTKRAKELGITDHTDWESWISSQYGKKMTPGESQYFFGALGEIMEKDIMAIVFGTQTVEVHATHAPSITMEYLEVTEYETPTPTRKQINTTVIEGSTTNYTTESYSVEVQAAVAATQSPSTLEVKEIDTKKLEEEIRQVWTVGAPGWQNEFDVGKLLNEGLKVYDLMVEKKQKGTKVAAEKLKVNEEAEKATAAITHLQAQKSLAEIAHNAASKEMKPVDEKTVVETARIEVARKEVEAKRVAEIDRNINEDLESQRKDFVDSYIKEGMEKKAAAEKAVQIETQKKEQEAKAAEAARIAAELAKKASVEKAAAEAARIQAEQIAAEAACIEVVKKEQEAQAAEIAHIVAEIEKKIAAEKIAVEAVRLAAEEERKLAEERAAAEAARFIEEKRQSEIRSREWYQLTSELAARESFKQVGIQIGKSMFSASRYASVADYHSRYFAAKSSESVASALASATASADLKSKIEAQVTASKVEAQVSRPKVIPMTVTAGAAPQFTRVKFKTESISRPSISPASGTDFPSRYLASKSSESLASALSSATSFAGIKSKIEAQITANKVEVQTVSHPTTASIIIGDKVESQSIFYPIFTPITATGAAETQIRFLSKDPFALLGSRSITPVMSLEHASISTSTPALITTSITGGAGTETRFLSKDPFVSFRSRSITPAMFLKPASTSTPIPTLTTTSITSGTVTETRFLSKDPFAPFRSRSITPVMFLEPASTSTPIHTLTTTSITSDTVTETRFLSKDPFAAIRSRSITPVMFLEPASTSTPTHTLTTTSITSDTVTETRFLSKDPFTAIRSRSITPQMFLQPLTASTSTVTPAPSTKRPCPTITITNSKPRLTLTAPTQTQIIDPRIRPPSAITATRPTPPMSMFTPSGVTTNGNLLFTLTSKGFIYELELTMPTDKPRTIMIDLPTAVTTVGMQVYTVDLPPAEVTATEYRFATENEIEVMEKKVAAKQKYKQLQLAKQQQPPQPTLVVKPEVMKGKEVNGGWLLEPYTRNREENNMKVVWPEGWTEEMKERVGKPEWKLEGKHVVKELEGWEMMVGDQVGRVLKKRDFKLEEEGGVETAFMKRDLEDFTKLHIGGQNYMTNRFETAKIGGQTAMERTEIQMVLGCIFLVIMGLALRTVVGNRGRVTFK